RSALRGTGAGLPRPVELTFDSGSTPTALAFTDLANQFSTNASLLAAGLSVSGTAGGALTFTSSRGEKFNVSVTGDTSNILGLGSFSAGSGPGNIIDYTTIQGAAYVRTTQYGTAIAEFSINGAASSGNSVS